MIPANHQTWTVQTVGAEDIYTYRGCQFNEDGRTVSIQHTVPTGTPASTVHDKFVDCWPNFMAEFGGAA